MPPRILPCAAIPSRITATMCRWWGDVTSTHGRRPNCRPHTTSTCRRRRGRGECLGGATRP
jgi:hypothetical protein